MDAFTLVAKLILDKSEFNSGIKGAENSLNSEEHKGAFSAWGAAMGQLAGRAIEATLRASMNFAKSIFETGMDFDAQMSNVKAIGQMTDDELEAVRTRAMELGASTKFTAEEVGQAFGYMALAGWNTEEMLAGIDGVLSLAAASGENLGSVSDIVTDALTAFGLEAKDAGHFVDVLAQASANSNTTVAMMGEAFKYIAPVAGSLGYTIDDVAVALGIAANNGIKASQAGTSLRQILATMQAPGTAAADAMEKLGISLFDANGGVKSFGQVMNELRAIYQNSGFDMNGRSAEEMAEFTEQLDALLNAGDIDEEEYVRRMEEFTGANQEFLAALNDIAGLRGISTMLALMRSTDKDFDGLVESIGKSEGAAQEMAETMIDNLRGDITILNSALDGLKILISDEYKGYFRDFVQMITEGIGDMSKAFSEGGLVGMFTNLTDWVINGVTDALTNHEVTGEGVNRFGVALGTFVGNLISTLVTSAPQLISGLFEAGVSLAGGLVEGLFAGLFGTGEGSVYGFMTTIENEKEDAIREANKTAVQASGIVAYMEALTKEYGEAAKDSKDWADALERLEKLIPGVTKYIGEQGGSLSDTVAAMKEYVEQTKQAAVLTAQQKALESYQNAYAEALAAQGEKQGELYLAQYQGESARQGMIEMLNDLWRQTGHEGPVTGAYGEALDLEHASMKELKGWTESIFDMWTTQIYSEMDPDEAKAEYDTMKATIDGLVSAYDEAEKAQKKLPGEIKDLSEATTKAQARLVVVERALQQMADSAEDLSARMDETVIPGAEPEGSHAKGLNYVPFDNYIASLHRGEMILNQAQARDYRSGGGGMIDTEALYNAVAGAVSAAIGGIQVNLDGRAVGNAVSGQVSRNIYRDQLGRRIAAL